MRHFRARLKAAWHAFVSYEDPIARHERFLASAEKGFQAAMVGVQPPERNDILFFIYGLKETSTPSRIDTTKFMAAVDKAPKEVQMEIVRYAAARCPKFVTIPVVQKWLMANRAFVVNRHKENAA